MRTARLRLWRPLLLLAVVACIAAGLAGPARPLQAQGPGGKPSPGQAPSPPPKPRDERAGQPQCDDKRREFLQRLYRELLGREPDQAALTQFCDPKVAETQIRQVIASSTEYRTRVIQRLYRELLGRDADPAGLNFWLQAMQQGTTEAQVRQAVMNSAEYRQKHPEAAAEMIRRLYRELLGRDPDPSGLNFWLQRMQQGMTEAQLRQAIMNSDEYRTHVIQRLYRELLGREPDQAGLNTWLQAMRQGATEAQVRQAIMASAEYRQRNP